MASTTDVARRMMIDGFEFAEATIGAPEPLTGWADAVVPGGVHESLLANGVIAHPYTDRNEPDVRWIENRDWWYRAAFSVPHLGPDERLRVVFNGLDTVVDVNIDGELVGRHVNMFRPFELDLTHLAPGTHQMTLRFSPPLSGLEVPDAVLARRERFARERATDAPSTGPNNAPSEGAQEPEGIGSDAVARATQRRKAAFSWGWDFAPRVPSVGIWLPVELVRERIASVIGHRVATTRVDADGTAHVSVRVEVDDFAHAGPLEANVTLTTPSGVRHRQRALMEHTTAHLEFDVEDAELWWTHDLGAPDLHELTIELEHDSVLVGRVEDWVGLRTIELDRSVDSEDGRLFAFKLNGVQIFARGANWIPASMLVGSVSDRLTRDLVSLAADGGMNMLRVWGGGIYERDAFYRSCDEQGVLVWQDFAFACSDYPDDDNQFIEEVRLEAEYQVRRLRNRASLALWCGSNEVQALHGIAFQSYSGSGWGARLFDDILPVAVERHASGSIYWPGSPWGEDPSEGWMTVNGVRDGDRHAWEVWHGHDVGAGGGPFASIGEARHYRRYENDRGKFISEFGIHASPELNTLKRWMPGSDVALRSSAVDAHNKDNPKDKHDPVLEIVTGLPDNLDEYVEFTMASQAEGLKFGIEHYRRRQPQCSGTLVWQFNDPWPGITWSLVDVDLVPKAAYYRVRRTFSPLLASFRVEGDRLELWLTNSGRQTDYEFEVSVLGFDGHVVTTERLAGTAIAGSTEPVWSAVGVAHRDRYAWVEGSGVCANRVFFAEIRDLPLEAATIETQVEVTGEHTATLRLQSPTFVYAAHVPTTVPGIRFNDNYVDLRPGRPVTITVSGLPSDFDPTALHARPYITQRRRE